MLNLSNIKGLFLLLLIGLVFQGCHKDPVDNTGDSCSTCPDGTCQDYVWPNPIVFDYYITTGIQYTKPFFNPNNSDEFIYVKEIPQSGSPIFELTKHVISSGQETILCNTEFIIDQPQWGETGWIIFSRLGNTIMKINQDGTGLTQVTPTGKECFKPCFNSSGTRFITMGSKANSNANYRPVFDLSGVIVDSVKYEFNGVFIGDPYSTYAEFDNGYFVYSDHNTPSPFVNGYCKLNDNDEIDILNQIDKPNGKGLPIAMCMNGSSLYHVQHKMGLYRFDLATQQTTLLMSNCQSRYIRSVSMSPDGKHIIYEQVKGFQTGNGDEVDEQSDIYTINVDTKEKTKIIYE